MFFKTLISFAISTIVAGCVSTVSTEGDSRFSFDPPAEPTLTIHADVRYTDGERAVLQDSADIWSYQTDGLATVKLVFDFDPEDPASVKANEDNNTSTRLAEGSKVLQDIDCEASEENGLPPGVCVPLVLAFVSPSGGIHNPSGAPVQLNWATERCYSYSQLDHGKCLSVVLHEMGHVFGIPHLRSPQAAMFPVQNSVKTCLRQPDLAEFCAINVCGDHVMKPCEK